MSWLPKISMGLTLDARAQRLRRAECGGPLLSVKPWRQADELGSRKDEEAKVSTLAKRRCVTSNANAR
jgi:hypothetical protein